MARPHASHTWIGFAALLAGCGGRVVGAPETDASSDTAVIEDGLIFEEGGVGDHGEVGPGSCGIGPCTPGELCTLDCNTCKCAPGGEWSCTTMGCPPPPPPCPSAALPGAPCPVIGQACSYVNDCGVSYEMRCAADSIWKGGPPTCSSLCPPAEPTKGSPCVGPIDCTYKTVCGIDTASCGAAKSYWAIAHPTPCGGPCPSTEPKVGDVCLAGGKCSYVSTCGVSDTIFCNGTGVVESIDYGKCPSCPSTAPAPATSCPGPLTCKYTSTCGGTDVASCTTGGAKWTVLRGDCPDAG